jgi:hypothetical protein
MLKIGIIIVSGITFLTIACIFCLWFFIYRHTGYRIQDEKVNYTTWDAGRGKKTNQIPGADPKTFSVIEDNYENLYAKDKNQVYYAGKIVEGADPETFELTKPLHEELERVMVNGYMQDATQIYQFGRAVVAVDRESFQYLGEGIAKDKNSVFVSGTVLESAVSNSYIYLGSQFGKDQQSVFSRNKVLEGANPGTFHVNSDGTASDGRLNFNEHGTPL